VDYFREIFESRWYTNHGPLAEELEERLEKEYGCHVVTIVSAPIAQEFAELLGGEVVELKSGACVLTDDEEVAEKLRNMRSSYGRRKQVDIPLSANGRFSEAQAAQCLSAF
jgi:dTDP-4-amino-4,6-dideoxygalactose transaminase